MNMVPKREGTNLQNQPNFDGELIERVLSFKYFFQKLSCIYLLREQTVDLQLKIEQIYSKNKTIFRIK